MAVAAPRDHSRTHSRTTPSAHHQHSYPPTVNFLKGFYHSRASLRCSKAAPAIALEQPPIRVRHTRCLCHPYHPLSPFPSSREAQPTPYSYPHPNHITNLGITLTHNPSPSTTPMVGVAIYLSLQSSTKSKRWTAVLTQLQFARAASDICDCTDTLSYVLLPVSFTNSAFRCCSCL